MKSNGSILCNCDYGERITLGGVAEDDPDWSVEQLFANQQYRHLRHSLANGKLPWPDVCEKCAFIRYEVPFYDDIAHKCINKFQVEPSLLCNLRCPCCFSIEQRKHLPLPHLMSLTSFEKIIKSLHANNYAVDTIEFCGQGEPLLHPQIASFSEISRRYFPQARQRLITNGNFDYHSKLAGVELDELYVSCDGVRQENYARYRINGNVSKVLQFLADAPRQVNGRRQRLIWKYILFEFNDSESELLEAQDLAQKLEVDRLLFILTNTQYKSQRYDHQTVAALPIKYTNVNIESHPLFEGPLKTKALADNTVQEGKMVRPQNKTSKMIEGHIDEVLQHDKTLYIKSWAFARHASIADVEIHFNGKFLGTAFPDGYRHDVTLRYPEAQNARCTFNIYCLVKEKLRLINHLQLSLISSQGEKLGQIYGFYTFCPRLIVIRNIVVWLKKLITLWWLRKHLGPWARRSPKQSEM